ncbi:response regulator [Cohnella sp. LGH]|uniref:ATP-binding response regulator n=1 Tax=Cohnella sp. LGH TaxID=1619153 RepID=UPI001ADA4363|nr:ATP-binding protein [Cohnella sp. LGH]QTH43452.1 response regulator [Cohnella sp. LGH]
MLSLKSHYYKRSITTRFASLMIVLLLLVFVGAAFIYWNDRQVENEYREVHDRYKLKQQLTQEAMMHLNGISIRSFAYLAAPGDREYELVVGGGDQLSAVIAQYAKLSLEGREQEFAAESERFRDRYFKGWFPDAAQLAKDNDRAGLRRMFASEEWRTLERLVQETRELHAFYQQKLEETNSLLADSVTKRNIQFIVYVSGIVALSGIVIFMVARDFGMPISRLAANAKQFAAGREQDIRYTNRQDEIGGLARAMEAMMSEIQAKAGELLAQNEELLAQQEELQAQQDELTKALGLMEENEARLRRGNEFVQALANTLDRSELLKSIIRNMVHILKADKGIVIRLTADRDHAAYGLSENAIRRFVEAADDGLLARVKESATAYSLERPAKSAELGYHGESDGLRACDFYLPVLNPDNKVTACIVLTRIGSALTDREEAEASAFAKQISISLDKLELYEKAERQRQMVQTTLDALHEGVQLTDREGTTVLVNARWIEMMGEKADRSWNPTIEQYGAYIQPYVKDPVPFERFIADIVDGQHTEAKSIVYEWKGLVKRHVQMYYEPLYRGGERIGTLFVHRDVTQEREMDRVKSEFVSTVSHELRTPLASVLGFAELLLYKELAPERQKKYVRTIHKEASRLTALINDFLDLQRMESGKQTYDFRQVNVMTLVQEVMEMHQVASSDHRFEWLQHTDETEVYADADKLKQALMNLVGNAVKYSPNGGTVTAVCSEENGQLRIDVTDQGLGIPPEALSGLFSKFYRVDNSDRREIGGTGLGLAIVKEIMDVHKGRALASSIYGQGSTFSLLLPLPARSISRWRLEAAASVERAGEVYLVEDDSDFADLLADELEASGYGVSRFSSEETALKALEQYIPGAIILDLVLERGTDGWRLAERLKQDERLRDLPIIVSSALEEQERARRLGVSEYLVKPYSPGKLVEALKRVMADHSI